MRLKDSGVDWIGKIPEGWKTFRQMDVSSEVKHVNARLQETNLLSLSYGKIVRKDIKSVTGLLPESFEGYNIIEPRDVVVRLTDLQNDHHSIRVARSSERGIITSAYITLRPNSLMDSGYFYYGLLAFDIQKELYGMGGGVRQSLNYDQFKRMMLPVPTIDEQRRIVAYLDKQTVAIDSRVAVLEQKLAAYKRLKASVINRAVTRGLDPKPKLKDSGVKWLSKTPKDWKRYRLKDITNLDPLCEENAISGNVSFVPMECLRNDKIEKREIAFEDAVRKYTYFSNGDVLVAKVTPCFENGNIAVAEELLQGVGFGSSEIFVLRANDQVVGRFLFYLVQSLYFGANACSTMCGFGGLKRISPLFMTSQEVYMPVIAEQRAIADYLDVECAKIDKMAELVTREVELYKKLKRSLINEVVTGKREVA